MQVSCHMLTYSDCAGERKKAAHTCPQHFAAHCNQPACAAHHLGRQSRITDRAHTLQVSNGLASHCRAFCDRHPPILLQGTTMMPGLGRKAAM